jgi:hypothetical protein
MSPSFGVVALWLPEETKSGESFLFYSRTFSHSSQYSQADSASFRSLSPWEKRKRWLIIRPVLLVVSFALVRFILLYASDVAFQKPVTNFSAQSVARIAYLCSDVVVSVQPSLATDSDFSSHLRALVEKKTPGVLCRGVPEVNISSGATTWLRAHFRLIAATRQTQCRPFAFSLSAHPVWQAHVCHYILVNLDPRHSASLQTCKRSCGYPCVVEA